MFSAIFIDRPRLATVIAIVMTIAGLLSLFVIPIAQYPDIVPPQVSVTTTYPGASAAVVEATVAQPIESQVVGVDKMIYMKSVSGNDGSYSLKVSFELGTDPDINTVNVNNRVQIALSKLPEDVRKQGLTVKKQSSALLGVIALYSPKQTHDELYISNYATINLLDQIRSTPGVGDATLFGPQDYSMRAWVRTDRLTGLGLTTADVINAIQSQNLQAAVGRIGARPIGNDQQLQLNIQTKGRLSSVPEFEQIVIRTNPDGSVLRLGDVARLQLGAANLDRSTRLNGAPAALLAVYQSPGANALTALGGVKQAMADAAHDFPDDLAWKVTYDPTTFVTATIHEVQKTLIEAFILVVLVVYLFLGNLRATLIPTVAVPVSLIGTFIVLNAIGYSANTVSLLAIVLAIGIVVDDAIVVVEAVEQVMEHHPELTPAEATKMAMGQIFAPIIAITLVLLSVFVPVAFIPGISGELFRQFAVTVAVSMFLSAINALTLSPALCAILLRPHHGPRRGPIGALMRGIDWVRDGYGAIVARLVRMSFIGLVMVGVAMAGVWGLGKITPTGFLPEDDQGAFFIVVQLPDGASIGRTTEVVRQIEDILKQETAVADYSATIGLNFIDNYSQPNAAFFIVSLKPFEDRADASQSAQAMIARLGGKMRQVRGGRGVPIAPPPIIGLGTGGGFSYVLQDTGGGSAQALAGVLRGLLVAANQDPKLNRVFSTFSASTPSVYLDIDRDKAQILKVDLADDLPGAAGVVGRILRQRHEPVRAHLAGAGAGGSRRSIVGGRHLPDQCPQRRQPDDSAAQPGRGAAGDRAAGADPLQQPDRRDDPGQPGSRYLVRSGAGGDGAGCREHAAARIPRSVDRCVVPGEASRGQDRDHSRLCGAVRLPVPGGAVRELDDPGSGSAVGHDRHRRILCRIRRRGDHARSLRADRHGGADRAGGQERHPDRGIRQGAPRRGDAAARSGNGGCPIALPSGDDDIVRLHPGPAAVGHRRGAVATRPAECRDAGVRRHALGIVHRHLRDSGTVCHFSIDP